MPPKIRELIALLEQNGFVNRGGKGSHRNYEHPSGLRLTVSGKGRRRCKEVPGKAGQGLYSADSGKMRNTADQYEKIVYWSDEDECFVGVCPEFFAGGVHGDDPSDVFKELLELVDEWVEIFERDGRPLPEPKHAVLQAA